MLVTHECVVNIFFEGDTEKVKQSLISTTGGSHGRENSD